MRGLLARYLPGGSDTVSHILRPRGKNYSSLAASVSPKPCGPVSRTAVVGLSRDALGEALLTSDSLPPKVKALMEQRKYMQDDIWRFLYTRGVEDFDDMTSLSKDVRAALKAGFEVGNGIIKSNLTSKDGTRKWLIGFGKGADIETVLIPSPTDPKSGTVCVSSQVGCSLSCSFCHTGTQKLLRNLAANEILSQVMHAMRSVGDFPLEKGKRRNISNVVFMGQGEPLYNFRNVSAAISLLTSRSALDMARWRITLSTSGVAPLMEQVGKDLGVGLAVSLHAVTDPLRDVLVPLNKQYPIKEVLNGCHKYLSHMPKESRHRRITFEYVMLDGVNDTPADARHLTRLIGQMPSHVNLIPFNPWPGSDYKPSTDGNIQRFRKIVDEAGIACHVRLPKGQDIMAACGQLKSSEDRKRIRAAAKTLDPVQE